MAQIEGICKEGDFDSFSKGVANQSIAKDLYNDVRAGMGLTEIMGYATYNPKRTTVTRKVKPEDQLDTRSYATKDC